MINKTVLLKEIHYTTKDCSDLLDSIRKRGVAIPVQVNVQDDGYECVDGHRRLSACAILSEEDPKFEKVTVMIMNDYSKAGSGFWGKTQNKH
jgi:ParB-like chromosome segregation protein Spo0J